MTRDMSGKSKTDGNARAERLAEQLRANLRRRKAQAKSRAGRDEAEQSGTADTATPERENDDDG